MWSRVSSICVLCVSGVGGPLACVSVSPGLQHNLCEMPNIRGADASCQQCAPYFADQPRPRPRSRAIRYGTSLLSLAALEQDISRDRGRDQTATACVWVETAHKLRKAATGERSELAVLTRSNIFSTGRDISLTASHVHSRGPAVHSHTSLRSAMRHHMPITSNNDSCRTDAGTVIACLDSDGRAATHPGANRGPTAPCRGRASSAGRRSCPAPDCGHPDDWRRRWQQRRRRWVGDGQVSDDGALEPRAAVRQQPLPGELEQVGHERIWTRARTHRNERRCASSSPQSGHTR